MQTITFTVYGNQENPNGNPIPYFRTTQGSKFTDGALRYNAWKQHVQKAYKDAIGYIPASKRTRFTAEEYRNGFVDFEPKKPIPASKEKQWMTLKIYWMNNAHGDCDNIFKGIADALFTNDKYLASHGFDYEYAEDKKGKVEITLTL